MVTPTNKKAGLLLPGAWPKERGRGWITSPSSAASSFHRVVPFHSSAAAHDLLLPGGFIYYGRLLVDNLCSWRAHRDPIKSCWKTYLHNPGRPRLHKIDCLCRETAERRPGDVGFFLSLARDDKFPWPSHLSMCQATQRLFGIPKRPIVFLPDFAFRRRFISGGRLAGKKQTKIPRPVTFSSLSYAKVS